MATLPPPNDWTGGKIEPLEPLTQRPLTSIVHEGNSKAYPYLQTVYLRCTVPEVRDVCFLFVDSLKTILIDEHVFERVSPLSRHPPSTFKEAAMVFDLAERFKALPELTEFVRVCKNEHDVEKTRTAYKAKPSPLENAITSKLGKEMSFVSTIALEDSALGRSLLLL
jgi:hypothetical protein